jgi:hypothetical protein
VSTPVAPWVTAQVPSDEGVRFGRLKAPAALRDSGTLTEE